MFFQYNGVTLELVSLDHVSREGVYTSDGMDLLYVHWIIGATCIFSPNAYPVGTAATSITDDTKTALAPGAAASTDLHGTNPSIPVFTQEANRVGAFGTSSAFNAVVTDAEVKNRLWIPRQKLIIGAYNNQTGEKVHWVESPKGNQVCDIYGGPRVLSVDVVSAQGEGQTFGVHMQVETFISPCPLKSDRLLLAHRWQMQHTHDEDNYLTRVVQGEAVFNQAFVQSQGLNPDLVRSQIYHPIPLGFQRHLGPIVLSPDGSTLKYEYADTDTTITFDPGDSGATRMEIIENMSYIQPQTLVPQSIVDTAALGVAISPAFALANRLLRKRR